MQVDSDQVGRPSRAAAWSGAAICVLTVVAASSAVGLALGNDGVDREIWSLLPAVVPFGLVGGFIVARRPRNPVGWLLAATGLAFTFQQLAGHYAYYGLVTDPGSLPATPGAIWAQTWLPAVGLVAAFVLMPLHARRPGACRRAPASRESNQRPGYSTPCYPWPGWCCPLSVS